MIPPENVIPERVVPARAHPGSQAGAKIHSGTNSTIVSCKRSTISLASVGKRPIGGLKRVFPHIKLTFHAWRLTFQFELSSHKAG